VASALDVEPSELLKTRDTELPSARLADGAVELLATWAAVPDERRDRAMRVLREFTR